MYELGIQGHIEDIAIASDMQGKKFGIKLIKALDHIGKEVGCYKVCCARSALNIMLNYLSQFWTVHQRMLPSMRSVSMKKPGKKCTITMILKLRSTMSKA